MEEKDMNESRRGFIKAAAAAGLAPALFADGGKAAVTPEEEAVLAAWQGETDQATSDLYGMYFKDGDTRGLASLEKLEAAFEKVMREAKETKVSGDRPAVWSVYKLFPSAEPILAADGHAA